MTNGDKFRREVSDEDLANAFTYYCCVCPARFTCDDEATRDMSCYETFMYWLKEEAEDGQH